MKISCIILSGGRATRMNGIDKGLINLNDKPLIEHVITRIKPQVDEILINSNRAFAQYAHFGLPIYSDENPELIGPLAGFSLGLQHSQFDHVLTVPCDSPMLPPDLVHRLFKGLSQSNADIAVASSNGDLHPVFCLMKKMVLPSLTDYLHKGQRKVSDWQQSQHCIEVDFSDTSQSFANLNTPEDLNQLQTQLSL